MMHDVKIDSINDHDHKDTLVLVTGGTGAMGSVLVRDLISKGFATRVLTLPQDPLVKRFEGTGADIRFGNVANAAELHGICEGVSIVYHLAAIIISDDPNQIVTINVKGTENIVNEARKGNVRHFIHVSSASVVYPKPTPYSQSKQKAEAIVANSGLSYTIVRPTLVYGKKGGQEFDMFLRYLDKFWFVPFIGSGNGRKRPVYVDNLVDGLLRLSSVENPSGAIYNFSGAESITMKDFARLCLILMGKENKKIIHLPVSLCLIAAWLLNKIMKNPPLQWNVIAGVTQDADLDPGDAVREIGYVPSQLSQSLAGCFPRT